MNSSEFFFHDSFIKCRIMELQSCCVSCLLSQVEKAFHRLKPEASNHEIVAVQKRVMQKFGKMNERSMPYYGQALYQTINIALDQDDPYHQTKVKSNEIALKLIPKINEFISKAENPLQTVLGLAILGNTVDFGTPHQINLEEDLTSFSLDQLSINHFTQFTIDLVPAKSVLIIGDNCGECIFDLVLLKYLNKQFPEKEYYYAVRGGPVINDCTINDIQGLGFEKVSTILESSASPGVILEHCSLEFQNIFNSVDLIISKGQGNFEALDDNNTHKGLLYFFLKAKCNHIASVHHVSLGSLILKKQKIEKYIDKKSI